MSTLEEKFRLLVERLYKKTLEHHLEWSQEGPGGQVICSQGENYIRAYSSVDEDEPFEHIEILNKHQEPIDTFVDSYIAGVKPKLEGFDSYYMLMNRLRRMAFRQASGADEALDRLLGSLDDSE